MPEYKLAPIESRFADLIWQNEPLASSQLVKLAQEQLEWKKSTTYTVLKRLCERRIFQNENGTVTSLLSKEEFQSAQSEEFVNETFGGSLPAFLAAFGARKKLSQKDITQLENLIREMKEG